MGDIDKVRQIHSNWLEFIKKYYQYYYHGVSQRCVKDYYFIPRGFLVLKDKFIPPIYEYQFNGGGSFGGLSIAKDSFYRGRYKENGSYGWSSFSNSITNYGGLLITWNNPPIPGSISYSVSVMNLNVGNYGIAKNDGCDADFNTDGIFSASFTSTPDVGATHTYTYCHQKMSYTDPPRIDYFITDKGVAQDISVDYRLHWGYLPDGQVMIWDNLGAYGYGRSFYKLRVWIRLRFYSYYGCGTNPLCLARLQTLSNLRFYNVIIS